jgi:hypothetical protein
LQDEQKIFFSENHHWLYEVNKIMWLMSKFRAKFPPSHFLCHLKVGCFGDRKSPTLWKSVDWKPVKIASENCNQIFWRSLEFSDTY